MTIDPQKIKKDFPLLNKEIMGMPITYLDNAATSQKPKKVIDEIKKFYENYNSNVHRGIYTLSENATEMYEEARKKVKEFINANSIEEVIFTSGTTESINLVAYSLAKSNLKNGDIVLVSEMEHHSNFVPWYLLEEKYGIERKLIPVHKDGTMDMEAYEELLENENVKLAAFTHVSNVLGSINPVKKMTEMAQERDVLVLIDGAQAAPRMKVDMQSIDCDFYAFSGHKMLGPTGIGVLYAKKEILEEMEPFMGGGDMISVVKKDKVLYNELPYKFEAGTPNIAGAIALASAIDYLEKIGLNKIHKHESKLMKYAYKRINQEFKVKELKLYGPSPLDKEDIRTGVLPFTVKGIHAHDISSILNEENICVRSGHHCAQPLIEKLGIDALSRASFYLYNTEEDVDALIKGIKKAQEIFK